MFQCPHCSGAQHLVPISTLFRAIHAVPKFRCYHTLSPYFKIASCKSAVHSLQTDPFTRFKCKSAGHFRHFDQICLQTPFSNALLHFIAKNNSNSAISTALLHLSLQPRPKLELEQINHPFELSSRVTAHHSLIHLYYSSLYHLPRTNAYHLPSTTQMHPSLSV